MGFVGSIPACAGEPRGPGLYIARSRVYPRVCGGTKVPEVLWVVHEGLSPRVRGNPDTHVLVSSLIGSIPACAGEP